MTRRVFSIAIVLLVWTGNIQRQLSSQEGKSTDRGWVVGTWRSYKLDYGDFAEWKGTVQIELVATSAKEVGLFLLSADGKRTRAGDSQPSILDSQTLFFGPVGSGLKFDYRRPNHDVLILDLRTRGTAIHAELNREKK